ncbi:MAG: response regulator transcription factor [Alphaproteobacteria bacterium]|nr:response regulator transcription factor [Alphaproteobacteria bacterium]
MVPLAPRNLLLVELSERPSRSLRRDFRSEGFKADSAFGLEHTQNLAAMGNYNSVVLSGTSAQQLIKCLSIWPRDIDDNAMPVVCIADLTTDEEICVLNAGAAACLPTTTPFLEVLIRLRALLHIVEGFPQDYRIRELGIDPIRRKASRSGVPLTLRPAEFDTLLFLAERVGQLVTHVEIHDWLWPSRKFSRGRVAVQMHKVRRAIRDGRQTQLLHTVRDRGYLLSPRRPNRRLNSA